MSIPELSAPQLLAAFEASPDANAPQVLDVRRTPAFERDPVVIPGSVRCAPEEVPGLAGTLDRRAISRDGARAVATPAQRLRQPGPERGIVLHDRRRAIHADRG